MNTWSFDQFSFTSFLSRRRRTRVTISRKWSSLRWYRRGCARRTVWANTSSILICASPPPGLWAGAWRHNVCAQSLTLWSPPRSLQSWQYYHPLLFQKTLSFLARSLCTGGVHVILTSILHKLHNSWGKGQSPVSLEGFLLSCATQIWKWDCHMRSRFWAIPVV